MIFLTGATGLVGSFICRKLLQEGQQVKALKRANSQFSLLEDVKDHIQWVEGELQDVLFLQQAMQGCQAVIHSAGLVSYHKRDEKRLFQVNAEGTANMVNAALHQGIERFIHISSVAAVGRSAKKQLIDESFKWEDADAHTAYGMSKKQAEIEVLRGAAEGLNTLLLNPALVLGPGNWEQSSTRLFKYVYDQKSFYTDGWMNYIDVRDLAHITLQALQGKLPWGERYILSSGYIPYKAFFEMAATCLDRKAPSIRVNPYLLKTVYYLESLRAMLSGKAPIITRETLKLASQHIQFSNKKLTQALDYQATSLQDTVAWTCGKLLA